MAGTGEDFGASDTEHGGSPGVRTAPIHTQPDPRLPPDLDRSSLSQRERSLQLTRYVLLRRIGAGGMGVVYQAHDPSLDRKVAIKLLRAAPGDDPLQEAHARLLREAQALAKLSHPNVVTVHDVGTYDADALTTLRFGTANTDPAPRDRSHAPLGIFLVMEYVPGVTLAQWLDERVRTVREVIDVFLAAGRGLVAAHTVGVIHRDFKPSNVLVGETGRVCVFDFGLARAAGEAEPVAAPSAAFDPLTSAQLSAPLTRVGTLVGTPAYMAPEQRGGAPIDERADQYSFCVALHEALHGNRPFSGDNIFALEEAKIHLRFDPPRRAVRAPPAIHRAIVRGLAPDPEDRWPSMAALLAALERPFRARIRKRWIAGGLGLVLAGAAATVALVGGDGRPALCTGAAEALAPTWGPAQRDALTLAFATTGLAYAPDAAARAGALLDAYAAAWIAGHTDACEAANLRRDQSHDLLDRRMRCLESRRHELAALLAVLTVADADAVEHARDAVESLPAPARCADVGALLAEVDPPATEELAAAVEEVRAQLAAASAERTAGHLLAGLGLAEAAEQRSRALEYRPLRPEVLAELGEQLSANSDHAAHERVLLDGYWEALATRRDVHAFVAASKLMAHVGETLARPDDAQLWLHTAEALLDRIGRPRWAEARFEYGRGVLATARSEYAAGIEHYERSAALDSTNTHHHAQLLTRLANDHMSLGQLATAQETFERLVALCRDTYGPNHPSTALGIVGLGNVATLRGDFDTAERHTRAALAIWRAALPPKHERLAYPLSSIGDIALQRGDLDPALTAFDEARAIWEHNLGPRHTRVAAMLERLGTVEFTRGDLALAEQHASRALSIWAEVQSPDPQGMVLAHLTLSQIERARGNLAATRARIDAALPIAEAAFGPNHLYTAHARAQRATALARLDSLPAAEREADAAVAAIEATYGPDSVWLAEILGARAEVRRAQGRRADARADLERALALLAPHDAPIQRVDLDFLLAQVLWDMNEERGRARALAEGARATALRCGAARQAQLVEAWLAARPG